MGQRLWTLAVLATLGCGGQATEVPASAPSTAEVEGRWGLTVEAHRHTGKRYGMPANELFLELSADGTARWHEIPEPVWNDGAQGVLGRVDGEGRWTAAVHGGRGVVEIVDATGGTHRVGVLGAAPPYLLALEEAVEGEPEPKRLTLTRQDASSL